jgi:hydrogenase maturation protease
MTTPTPPPALPPSTIVIGVGTEMRGDDGFGAAVIEALRTRPGIADRMVLARCDGEPTRMVDLWDGYDCAVLVDAARGGTERYGYLYRRELTPDGTAAALLGGLREPVGGGHAAGPGSAVRLGEVLGRLPTRLILYAVHGRDFELGASLSAPVAAVVEQLAHQISLEVGHRRSSRPGGTKVP